MRTRHAATEEASREVRQHPSRPARIGRVPSLGPFIRPDDEPPDGIDQSLPADDARKMAMSTRP